MNPVRISAEIHKLLIWLQSREQQLRRHSNTSSWVQHCKWPTYVTEKVTPPSTSRSAMMKTSVNSTSTMQKAFVIYNISFIHPSNTKKVPSIALTLKELVNAGIFALSSRKQGSIQTCSWTTRERPTIDGRFNKCIQPTQDEVQDTDENTLPSF